MLKLRLLGSAFAPMFMIVALRLAKDHRIPALVLGLLSIALVFSLLTLLASREATNGQPYKLASVVDESAQVPSYLLTYVFPFIFVSPSNSFDLVAYASFVALLVVMLLRTELLLVNPVLLALGYHLLEIETSSGFRGLLLSRQRPKVGQDIDAVYWAPGALKLKLIKE